jgi:hypothetical protein
MLTQSNAKIRQTPEGRRYQRVRPSGVMAKTATILPGANAPSVTCVVIDYSLGGACLDLEYEVALRLPKRFELLYGGNKKKCRLVWLKGRRLGVCF